MKVYQLIEFLKVYNQQDEVVIGIDERYKSVESTERITAEPSTTSQTRYYKSNENDDHTVKVTVIR